MSEARGDGTHGDELGELYSRYVDRLNRGEPVDPAEVLESHPKLGAELLEMIECFVGAEREPVTSQLGDYTLAQRIGRGGMGVVYDAWQHSLDRRVALKVLPAGIAADPRSCARFMREAQMAGQLNHPNVVHVHGLGIEENTPYYAMEYVEGETLGQVLRRVKESSATPFGLRDSADYFVGLARAFVGVADGLHHAHSKRVVHRDVKPSNLILDLEGRLRILDFGLARLEGQESLTASGDLLGTPLYMSPEQARLSRGEVDHRTDVYSLGATLYETLCGRPPFQGRDHADTVSQIIERDPPDPTGLNARIPRSLETVVLKCLRKDPVDRYGSAEALAQDLTRFVKGEPVEARPEAAWARLSRRLHRNRAVIFGMVAIVLVSCVVSWLVLTRSRAEQERSLALYPAKIREAVGKLDSGAWVLRAASPPLYVPGIDFRVFEPDDFRDVIDFAGKETVRQAVAELEALVRDCPDEPEARYHLGRAYLISDRKEQAVAELERALAVDPRFAPAATLRSRITGEKQAPTEAEGGEEREWVESFGKAQWLQRRRRHDEAAKVLTRLVQRFERSKPPYTGFLTECYVERARARLALQRYDLAEEDCVRAHASNPASIAPVLLLGKIYLAADKPRMARLTFERLRSVSEVLDVLPFWVVSVHLSVPDADVSEALEWAGRVKDPALRLRLLTHLYTRLERWGEAVDTGRRAVEADPDGLVPRQHLAAALLELVQAKQRGESPGRPKRRGSLAVELATTCRSAVERNPDDLRSSYLVRAAWETLRTPTLETLPDELARARSVLLGAARTAGIDLPDGPRSVELVDDFSSDHDIRDGKPLSWRVVDECCPGEAESTGEGLRVTKLNDDSGHDAWLVTEEVFSGDVTVRAHADVGEGRIHLNLHVDLGTASLYYGGVSRSGRCDIARLEYAEHRARVEGHVDALEGDVLVELRSVGPAIELRVWPIGQPRPQAPALRLEDDARRLGAVGVSTNSRPATIRSFRAVIGREGS